MRGNHEKWSHLGGSRKKHQPQYSVNLDLWFATPLGNTALAFVEYSVDPSENSKREKKKRQNKTTKKKKGSYLHSKGLHLGMVHILLLVFLKKDWIKHLWDAAATTIPSPTFHHHHLYCFYWLCQKELSLHLPALVCQTAADLWQWGGSQVTVLVAAPLMDTE